MNFFRLPWQFGCAKRIYKTFQLYLAKIYGNRIGGFLVEGIGMLDTDPL
jgi:hypothetical protein